MTIFGIEIDNVTREEIIVRVKHYLDEPKFHQIATLNPEFLIEARSNQTFKNILQNCDMRIADGFGITLAMLFSGMKLKCRFPGADLMEEILSIADEKKIGVYLAIKKDGLSTFEEIKRVLSLKYPNLILSGTDIEISSQIIPSLTDDIFIVFCNFGAPEQEMFLSRFREQGTSVRLAIGVGGSFDYLTGKQHRAPRLLRTIGLEWLWRLVLQPKRWKRIWNAVILFPFYVFLATMKKRV